MIAVDPETLEAARIKVLKTVFTQHGTRYRIETDCGRVLWTYDLEGYAARRLSRDIAHEREVLESMHEREAAANVIGFTNKADLFAHIRDGINAGTLTIKSAAKKFLIPRSTLRYHLAKLQAASLGGGQFEG